MPNRSIVLLFVGVVLVLLLSVALPTQVSAQDSQPNWNPTSCEFQPPSADRNPSTDVIRQITLSNGTVTWDNTLVGLHRWNQSQIPAVDYLVDTTVPFKNGGVIARVYYDTSDGGYSLEINGKDQCQGWRVFIGHLSYDPTTFYSVGQEIGPNEIIGKPGCSGFENYCTDNEGTIPPHNHYGLGYWSNAFSFEDGTVPDFFGGYWWIHPSRVEGVSSVENVINSQTIESQESLSIPVEGYVTEFVYESSPAISAGLLTKIFTQVTIFRNLIVVLTALLIIVFVAGVIYSSEFRRSTSPLAVFVFLGLFFFVGVLEVNASSLEANAPRQQEDFFVYTDEDDSYTTDIHIDETEMVTDCSLPLSYPESIRQWCGYIENSAQEYDFDPAFIAAIMLQESGGDADIMSSAGAVGLLQVMPRDGISAGFICRNGPCFADRPTIDELTNPEFNIDYGVRMLRGLVDHYGSDRDGLMHYGPANIGYSYVDKVMAIYENYR